ncbi:MAG: hypothetical protein AAF517_14450, partial [Planctomycetota bacterium]
LEELGPVGGGGSDDAAKLAKDFLSENLQRLLQNEARPILQEEMKQFFAGDEMKVLLDDKFRAVTLYLKTDVIPNSVRQAMRKPNQ